MMIIIILWINFSILKNLLNGKLTIDDQLLEDIKFLDNNIDIINNSENNLKNYINELIKYKNNSLYNYKNLKKDTDNIFKMIINLDNNITEFYKINVGNVASMKIYLNNKDYKNDKIIIKNKNTVLKHIKFINRKKDILYQIIKYLNIKKILRAKVKNMFGKNKYKPNN